MKKVIFFLICFLSFSASAEILSVHVSRIVDGDTIVVDIPAYPDILGKEIPIRLRGIDTPEMYGKCPEERKLALQAKLLVESLLLKDADGVFIQSPQRGKYFRLVADLLVSVDGKIVNVASVLLDEGLAKPYHGGKKEEWCDSVNDKY